uniref:Anoctamin n=1 Tax=Anopheles maculatus TaxID=74869 RepID=A0A182SIE1_9DIPT
FNTSDYKEEWGTKTESDPDTCQYRGYRNGPDADEQYGLSPHYWHVFAARLAFVVIFEHIVFVLTGIMQFIIPDIPIEVKTQMQREQLLAKEAKYQHGLKKSRETDYEEILHTLREQSNNSRQAGAVPIVEIAAQSMPVDHSLKSTAPSTVSPDVRCSFANIR